MKDDNLPDLATLWDYNNSAETAILFRALLPRVAPGSAYHVELLTQLARTQGLQDAFDEAHKLLDEAEALLQPAQQIPRLRILLERGRTFNSAGAPETAVPLFQEAYELGLSLGSAADFHTVDAAHMLAIAESENDRQLDWNMRALELARLSTDERAQGWRGSLLNNIGWTFFDRSEYEKALALFEEALAGRLEANAERPQLVNVARWCVARLFRALGRVNEAYAWQMELLTENEAEKMPDGFVFEEVAECLVEMGREDEAQPYFAQAYELLVQLTWFAQGEPERLQRLKMWGADEA